MRDQTEIQDAERGVLGALLFRPDTITDVEHIARPQDFQDKRLGRLARTLYSLAARPDPVDLVTIVAQLRADSDLDKVGGAAFVAELATSMNTAAFVMSHAKLVRRAATLREAGNVCGAALQALPATSVVGDEPVQGFLEGLEAQVFALGHESLGGTEGGSVDQFLYRTIEQTARKPGGFGSGFYDLDDLVVQFQPCEMTVIGARPGVGKTSLGLSLLMNQCDEGARALCLSLEMGLGQLSQKLLSHRAEVNGYNLRAGTLSTTQRQDLVAAADSMANWKMKLYEDDGATVGRLASLARRAHRDLGGLDVVLVDYLQLMTDPASAKHGRTEEISNISRQLKGLARQMRVHVIALCQLSRAGVGRPGLHHLKESGSIEQDADRVMLLWDPEGGDKTRTHCSLEKNRHGATGTFDLLFDRAFGKHRNLFSQASETIPFNPDEFSGGRL